MRGGSSAARAAGGGIVRPPRRGGWSAAAGEEQQVRASEEVSELPAAARNRQLVVGCCRQRDQGVRGEGAARVHKVHFHKSKKGSMAHPRVSQRGAQQLPVGVQGGALHPRQLAPHHLPQLRWGVGVGLGVRGWGEGVREGGGGGRAGDQRNESGESSVFVHACTRVCAGGACGRGDGVFCRTHAVANAEWKCPQRAAAARGRLPTHVQRATIWIRL